MAYRSVIQEIPENLARTIKGTFVFCGRSTRTEVLTYIILGQILFGLPLLILYALFLDVDFDSRRHLNDAVTFLTCVPMFSLLVRRLHDQDRTGWWACIFIMLVVLAPITPNANPSLPWIPKIDGAWWLFIPFLGGIITLWVFTLWPPTEGPNKYGLDPRLDPEDQIEPEPA